MGAQSILKSADYANPFVGLMPYSEAKSKFFFGRAEETQIIADSLETCHLTILYSRSGTGKSSVLRAGVAGYLKKRALRNAEKDGKRRFAVIVYPALAFKDKWQKPLDDLIEQIREVLREINPDLRLSELGASVLRKISTIFTASIREISPEIEVSKIGKILRNVLKEISLDSQLSDIKKVIESKIRELEPEVPLPDYKSWFFETLQAYMAILKEEVGVFELYVILDQFEEYFGVHPQENEFDNEFVRAVNSRDIGVHFLISIRSEWITKLDRYKGQILDLFDRRIELKLFNKESGRQVIEEPIKEFFKQLALEKVSVPEGEVISGELVNRILNEVKDEVQTGCISLPYLQLVMKELWASICDAAGALRAQDGCPRSNSINMKDYEELGEECDRSFPESKNLNTIAEKIAYRYWNDKVNQFDFVDKLRTAVIFHYLPSASGCGIFYDLANLAKRGNEYREDYSIPLPALSAEDVSRLLEKLKDSRIVNALPGSQYEFFLPSLGKAAYYWQENQHNLFGRHYQTREEIREQQERERSKEEDKEWQNKMRTLLANSRQVKHEGDYTESQRWALNAYELNQKKLDSDTRFVASVDEILREALSRNICYSFCNKLPNTHQGDVAAVAVSGDGKWLASGGYDGIVSIWHLGNLDAPFLILKSQGRVNCLAFDNTQERKIMAVGTHCGIVELWDWSKPDAETKDIRRIAVPGSHEYESGYLLLLVLLLLISPYAPNAPNAPIASILDKYAFYLWDEWYGQRLEVRSVTFSHDGNLLASASWDKTVRVWDVSQPDDPKLVRILPKSEDRPDFCRDWFWSVAFSGNGRWLAAGCRNGTVWLWEKDGDGNGDYFSKQPIILPVHPETNWKDFAPSFLHRREILTVAFSPDSQILAAGSRDKKVRLGKMSQVEVPGVRPWQVLGGHKDMVRTVSFSSDGQFLASGGEDLKLRLWEINSLEPNSSSIVLNAPGNKFRLGVSSVDFSPDSQFLIAGSWDRGVRFWKKSLPPPLSVRVLGRHNNSVRALAFSPDGRWLASGSFDGTLRLWAWRVLGDEPQTLPEQSGEVRTVAFSPDGRLLASGGRDGVIRLWDVLNMKKELRFESSKPNEENKTEVLSLAFGASSKTWYLASGHSAEKNKPIKLWKFDNLNTGTPKTPQEIVPDPILKDESTEGGEVRTLAFSPDSQWLASGGSDGTVKLFDCQQFPPKFTKKIFVGEEVREVAFSPFSPKSQMMAIVTEDGTVQLWNLLPLPEEEPLFISYLVGNSVAFSPDPNEMMLATGSNSGTIGLWNLSQIDAFPLLLNGHQGMIRTLAFSPDGEFLASGGDDNTIRLWMVKTQTLAEEVSKLLGRTLPCSGEKVGDLQEEKLKRDFNSRKELLSSVVFSKEGELLERIAKLIQEKDTELKDIAEEDVANISDIFDQCQEERYGEAFCLLEDLVKLDFLCQTRSEGFRRIHYGLSTKYRQYLELVTPPSALPSPLPP